MLSIIITAFKEPAIDKAIRAIVTQKIPEEYELIVAAPDEETKLVVEKFAKRYPQVKYFKDPGKGKSFALNLLFKKVKGRILIFTDGDVYLGEGAVSELVKPFANPSIGVVSGRVVSANSKEDMLGYWSHLLCDAGAHSVRQELYENEKFLECTGYLFAIRANVVTEIPVDVAEDTIIPYYFWKAGHRIAYAQDAVVYVKWPTNFNDWIKQKTRTIKAHEKLTNYVPDFPKVKSFANEAAKGWYRALMYPKNAKEFAWTLALFPARGYVWLNAATMRMTNKYYTDAWEKAESTR